MGSMVFCDLPKLLKEYSIAPRGVVQVGAHTGEEIGAFMAAGFHDIELIEPNPSTQAMLRKSASRADPHSRHCGFHPFAVGCNEGEVKMLDHGRTQDASKLRRMVGKFSSLEVIESGFWAYERRLDSFRWLGECNLLVIDTQGTELDVLQSAGDKLNQFDMLIVEVDEGDRYVGSDHRKLLEWLDNTPFKPVASYVHGHDPKVSDRVFVRK